MTAPQTTATKDPQSIAALQQMLDAALAREAALAQELAASTAALAQRNSEYGERIEHQAATIDVLKEMSASPGDTQPVFDLIVRQARELCDGQVATLFEFDGHLLHFCANHGNEDRALSTYQALFPMAPSPECISGRAILGREVVHVRDMDMESGLHAAMRGLAHKSQISIPLLRDGVVIGAHFACC